MSGKDPRLHSKWVEKIHDYTRNEWKRSTTTLEMSGKDLRLHSKRVEKIYDYTRSISVLSGFWWALHGFWYLCYYIPRVGFNERSKFSTRFECSFMSCPLVSSVVFHLLHSFRVYFFIFSTRFECSFSWIIVPLFSVGRVYPSKTWRVKKCWNTKMTRELTNCMER